MGLKEEVEKLIQVEQERLLSEDSRNSAFWERQRQRFGILAEILERIKRSFEEKYLRMQIYPESAWVEVGRRKKSYFSADVCFRVEPDFGGKGDRLHERPGFRVEISPPQPEDHGVRKTLRLPNEKEVAEYLSRQIAERVAHYRSMERPFKETDTRRRKS